MQLFDTIHKRKSAIITAILLLLILLMMYGFGMRYMDPPIEYGVSINYGDSDVGSGEPVEKVKAAEPKVEEEQKEEPQEEVEPVEEQPKEEVTEDVITDETTEEDVPVVDKKEEKKEPVKEVKEEKPKEKPKPKPSKAATDALNSLLKGSSPDGEAKKGEGDDKEAGVKGDKSGDPDSNKYYGKAGDGSGGNYNLAGRKALSKPIQNPDCEEEGTVVVSIEVSKDGKVLKASPGARGTTNSAPCLFKAAKEAALKTKWNPDGNAPEKQRGTIIYKFSLSK
ncbi:energy transducer TonB [uncultured Tenacibaculum sp.]|uniref:energy transducer TonB family protein n=1 Tax=uncultured Tenacibaculum sp. TaxID=174713 RepID=UPI00263A30A7|nr:energy transducer TonB [uncultured Tenacibaculum sp.]